MLALGDIWALAWDDILEALAYGNQALAHDTALALELRIDAWAGDVLEHGQEHGGHGDHDDHDDGLDASCDHTFSCNACALEDQRSFPC